MLGLNLPCMGCRMNYSLHGAGSITHTTTPYDANIKNQRKVRIPPSRVPNHEECSLWHPQKSCTLQIPVWNAAGAILPSKNSGARPVSEYGPSETAPRVDYRERRYPLPQWYVATHSVRLRKLPGERTWMLLARFKPVRRVDGTSTQKRGLVI